MRPEGKATVSLEAERSNVPCTVWNAEPFALPARTIGLTAAKRLCTESMYAPASDSTGGVWWSFW